MPTHGFLRLCRGECRPRQAFRCKRRGFCPNCGGGELKITTEILERPVIEKILTHLGWIPDTAAS